MRVRKKAGHWEEAPEVCPRQRSFFAATLRTALHGKQEIVGPLSVVISALWRRGLVLARDSLSRPPQRTPESLAIGQVNVWFTHPRAGDLSTGAGDTSPLDQPAAGPPPLGSGRPVPVDQAPRPAVAIDDARAARSGRRRARRDLRAQRA